MPTILFKSIRQEETKLELSETVTIARVKELLFIALNKSSDNLNCKIICDGNILRDDDQFVPNDYTTKNIVYVLTPNKTKKIVVQEPVQEPVQMRFMQMPVQEPVQMPVQQSVQQVVQQVVQQPEQSVQQVVQQPEQVVRASTIIETAVQEYIVNHPLTETQTADLALLLNSLRHVSNIIDNNFGQRGSIRNNEEPNDEEEDDDENDTGHGMSFSDYFDRPGRMNESPFRVEAIETTNGLVSGVGSLTAHFTQEQLDAVIRISRQGGYHPTEVIQMYEVCGFDENLTLLNLQH